MYNEIDDDFKDVAISTFKVGLPTEHSLRKSLIANLLPVCANLWTGLISTRGLRKTNNKGKERIRLFRRR